MIRSQWGIGRLTLLSLFKGVEIKMRKPKRHTWKQKALATFGGMAIFTLTLVFTGGCNAGQAARDIGDGAADVGRATGGFFADVGGFMYDNTIGHFVADPNE